jgi:hypothetical protein
MMSVVFLCQTASISGTILPAKTERAIPLAVEDGTFNVAFRSAKGRSFRGAKGDNGYRERYMF